jgi:hypothetical protein
MINTGLMPLYLVGTGGRIQARQVQIADADHLDVAERGQRRIVDSICHPSGADHGDAYFALRFPRLGHHLSQSG